MLVLGAFAGGAWILVLGAFHPRTVMPVNPRTIEVLARAAAEKIGEFPLADRIRIYHALGESLPNDAARAAAMELTRILSQAAAMELEFQEQLKTNDK